MKLTLLISDPWAPSRRVVLDSLPAMVGRALEASVRLEDPWASRKHCAITQIENRIVVRDLGSKHGTYVNGVRVVEESQLMPGDHVTLGLTGLRVYYPRALRRASVIDPSELAGLRQSIQD